MSKAIQETIDKIITTLVITNRPDEVLATRGIITKSEIRSVELDNVLVDTGATTLCLPSDVIEKLGLELLR